MLTTEKDDPGVFSLLKITENDLGNMYLVYDQVLVVRSANSILFFKKIKDKWRQYYEFPDLRGQIYYIRGNIRI